MVLAFERFFIAIYNYSRAWRNTYNAVGTKTNRSAVLFPVRFFQFLLALHRRTADLAAAQRTHFCTHIRGSGCEQRQHQRAPS